MPFLVVPPGRPPRDKIGFILRQDRWNDFGFQTQYQLFHGDGNGPPDLIGDVKILRKGQTRSDGIQISVGVFESLREDFCSVGQGLDYYERLAALGPERRDHALRGLRDIVQNSDLVGQFENEEGWSVSLFRGFAPDADFLTTARALVERDYHALPGLGLKFSFHPAGWGESLNIDFSAPASKLDASPTAALPARIAVLVGRNGSGKSTLLARLARVAHASSRDRQRRPLVQLGELTPRGIGFTRIVAVSYSAFDSFAAPGLTTGERQQVAREILAGTGRYMFCGLRDIGREVEELVESETGTEKESDILDERLPTNRIKTLDRLTEEFAVALKKVETTDRLAILRECTAPIFQDPSLYAGEGTGITRFLQGDPKTEFHALSTGHKIVLHVITSIVSHVERKSIVLFDEPETHLHPPLLAALMHALRITLHQLDAFAIVATHSPVVVQETLSRHVFKIVRNGDAGRIFPSDIETFGESIGAITSEVFSLEAQTTDYHLVLQALADAYGELDAVEAIFDRGLSSQGRAFVMSVLARRGEVRN